MIAESSPAPIIITINTLFSSERSSWGQEFDTLDIPQVVLTGNCGPKAFKTLKAAGVKVVVGVSGKIEEAIQAYLRGELEDAKDANVEGHWV